MAIGFPAWEEQTARYRGRSSRELLRAAADALDDLGWDWHREGRRRLVASTPAGFHYGFFLTFGDRVTVDADDGEVWVRSEGKFALAWLDFGQHRANLNRFLDTLEDFLDDRP
jgi:hypothetical protein